MKVSSSLLSLYWCPLLVPLATNGRGQGQEVELVPGNLEEDLSSLLALPYDPPLESGSPLAPQD